MKSLSGIFAAVEKEFHRSKEKHGSWKGLSNFRQITAIRGEVSEWEVAFIFKDINGPHGEIAELVQVMNVCARRILYLKGSPDA